MKLVFLNTNTRKLEIYDKQGVQHLPFSGVKKIREVLGKEEVLYITNVVKTNTLKLIDTVTKFNNQDIENAIENNEDLFMHSTNRGVIRIEDLKITFNGPLDFKSLKDIFEKFGNNVLEKNSIIKGLLEQGQLEILSETGAKYNKAQTLKEKEEKEKEIEKAKNKKEGKDEVDMWSDKNPLAINSTGGKVRISTSGSLQISSNEGSLLPDYIEEN